MQPPRTTSFRIFSNSADFKHFLESTIGLFPQTISIAIRKKILIRDASWIGHLGQSPFCTLLSLRHVGFRNPRERRGGRARFDLFEGPAGRVGQGLVRRLSFGASALASARQGEQGRTRRTYALLSGHFPQSADEGNHPDEARGILFLSLTHSSLCPSVLSPARLLSTRRPPPSSFRPFARCSPFGLLASGRTFPRHG